MTRRLFGMLMAFGVSLSLWAGEDVSGSWAGSPWYLNLKQDGGNVSGTGGPGKSNQVSVEDGRFEGNHLTFHLGRFAFDLKITGPAMQGEMRGPNGAASVYLKKVEPQRVGMGKALAFDVAVVKPAAIDTQTPTRRTFGAGRVTISNTSFQAILMLAYHVEAFQISGPDWMNVERYDISAKMPPETAPDDAMTMLQTLLTERFQLKLHRESREMPVYGLIVGKRAPKLKQVPANPGVRADYSPGHIRFPSISLDGLATVLSSRFDRPVLNMTGMTGTFEITLDWTPDAQALGVALFDAVEQQLGLELKARVAPVELLVVDSVKKVPAEN